MGLFDKAKDYLGVEDKELLANGVLARGNVKKVDPTTMTTGRVEGAFGASIVCHVTVEVVGLDGEEPYEATCSHGIPQAYLPKLMEEGAAVAVRVDPADPQHIELDLTTEVPPAPVFVESDDGTKEKVTTSKSTFTAAEILRDGNPCTVDVLAVISLNGQKNADGQLVTGLILNVNRDGAAPYQAQIGTPIPEAAVDKVVAGANLPAKWVLGPGLPTDVNLVTPDWPAILGG